MATPSSPALPDLSHESLGEAGQDSPSWATLYDEQELQARMRGLHIAAPVAFQSLYDSPVPRRPIQYKLLPPGQFAVIAVDSKQVVGVMDHAWFQHELREGWHLDVIQSLQEANVRKVHCCGHFVKLREVAGDTMQVYLDAPEANLLRFPCKFCGSKGCAVQKAFLKYRRLVKRRPCHLEH